VIVEIHRIKKNVNINSVSSERPEIRHQN
jgi:hypothetical protein